MIKQQGGVFGRNPTFNNVGIDGILTVDQIVEKTASGGTTLNGVTLKNGNVVVADGKGIDFSATPGTGTSELFADYERGDFTPTIIGSTAAGVGTYSAQVGQYTKIGDRVFFNIRLVWSAHTGTGNMLIAGLPFASSSASGVAYAATIGWLSGLTLTASNLAVAYIGGGSTQVQPNQYPVGNGSAGSVPIDTAAGLIMSGQYAAAY